MEVIEGYAMIYFQQIKERDEEKEKEDDKDKEV